ncbi:hypothetical protein FGADI_12403 [Fusarium gaditjirri]|uniref:2EXR domain-containing protein n=1 Tax=Fusarium gaditjirri TaxID=282569 RepID=A0A8H4WNC6_9HYPO|nr:hypothetical protein FGADI_12403 [Fusarium gaditjirri]
MTQPIVVKDPDHGVGLKKMEEMLPTTFHRFPNLPTELRLNIWKAACFPCTANQRGLHYIDLRTLAERLIAGVVIFNRDSMEMRALHPDFQTSPKDQQVVGRANRSAYMWDAGLWKACRESREIISMHFQLNIWRGTQGKGIDPLELDQGLSKACRQHLSKELLDSLTPEDLEEIFGKRQSPESSADEREPFLPTGLLFRSQEDAERFIVMPTRDLFCIKTGGDPRSQLPVTVVDPHLHVPCPNGQKIVLRQSFNLVLEYGWGNALYIYLLNKAARWGPHWRVKEDTVFYDCDYAYVEVDNNYFGFYPAEPAETSAMLRFLWRVWKLWTVAFCEDCTDDEICMICRDVPGFDLTKNVKVLVRHEKEAAGDQLEDRLDELDKMDNGNDCEIEHESEDGKEAKVASEF